jgi:hypothetical protein
MRLRFQVKKCTYAIVFFFSAKDAAIERWECRRWRVEVDEIYRDAGLPKPGSVWV